MWSHLHRQSPSTTTMSDRTLRPRPPTQSHGTTIFEDNPETLSDSSLSSESPEPISLPRKRRITKNHSAPPANTQPLPHLPQEASQLPVFAPIVPPTSPHDAYNTLPTHIRHSDHIEPVDILSLFLTKSLLQTMAANTNAYAAKQLEESRQSGESGGRKWEEVAPEELGLWLGIVLYMGVCSAPAVKDYWSHDSLTAIHPIRDYMSQTRFEQIKRYYHVAAPVNCGVTMTSSSFPGAPGGLCSSGHMTLWL